MNSIYVAKSTIQGAGMGVFANKDIKPYTKLGEYIGKVYNANDYLYDNGDFNFPDLSDNKYLMITTKNGKIDTIINGLEGGNWTTFINGVKTDSQIHLENCEFYQYGGKIFVRTIRNITKNEELIIDYGPSYDWN